MATAAWDGASWAGASWASTSWDENAEEWPAEAMSAQSWTWPDEAMSELQSHEVIVDHRLYDIPPEFSEKTWANREATRLYLLRRFRECKAPLKPPVWEVW